MWIFNFYRLYFAILVGFISYFFLLRRWWFSLLMTLLFRVLWGVTEYLIKRIQTNNIFKKYSFDFKQKFGPYGIRIINKGEQSYEIRKSLCEVFTDDERKLSKVIEELETMNALFNAGLRPEGDNFLLYDLKLKYAREHLSELRKKK
ncbi:MAG: hypothetical protein N2053_06640 [Chitinispirillaceae bacterium]|nr:hypothetical protein [Chitinispirillaceae bacterium]